MTRVVLFQKCNLKPKNKLIKKLILNLQYMFILLQLFPLNYIAQVFFDDVFDSKVV